ncbi:MAG: lipopolysaccharide kinase InaA family protein [Candidatus Muiribacteriaceae bacterium]
MYIKINPVYSDISENLINVIFTDAELIYNGRNQVYRKRFGEYDLAFKVFGRNNLIRKVLYRFSGSKGSRTYQNSQYIYNNSGLCPEPVALYETEDGLEVFVSEFIPGMVSFKEELIKIYREECTTEILLPLLQKVAVGIKRLHDSGFIHKDLGNQNIFFADNQREKHGTIFFIDLNRGEICGNISDRKRGADLARITLPSDMRRIFLQMYWQGEVPPHTFVESEKKSRRIYSIHAASRVIRHPLRSLRLHRDRDEESDYPSEKDIFIWDEKSAQAVSVMMSEDKGKYRNKTDFIRLIIAGIIKLPLVWFSYRRMCREKIKEVDMTGRVGICIDFRKHPEEELRLLEDLPEIPVFIRFYAHEKEEVWKSQIKYLEKLRSAHNISVALVQDRKSVILPGHWDRLLEYVIPLTHSFVDLYEVGHAVNRVKWGIWGSSDYLRLLGSVKNFRKKYNIRIIGPAVIDFEYHYAIPILSGLGRRTFSALSIHLYVDRRGAPENCQGSFSLREKCLLAKAVAESLKSVDDKTVISEFNWPVRGTGEYSPIGSPYVSPGIIENPIHVSEEQYADYMIRYFLIALCLGKADRAYIFRLIAKGFGLCDSNPGIRKRPAFYALVFFCKMMKNSVFCRFRQVDLVKKYYFHNKKNGDFCMMYTEKNTTGKKVKGILFDISGKEAQELQISETPLYKMKND